MKRFVSVWVIVSFIASLLVIPRQGYAQEPLNLPLPGTMVNLSPAYVPVLIKGLKVHPENPLLFDFILDTGKSGLKLDSPEFNAESEKLIKYFLASLTIKEDDLWVNLSPYEKDRIIPDKLGNTELGRDMLAQDYILKQLTASLIYPERKLGREFWDRVYAKSEQMFGTTNVPVNTFNKVWIVADKAKVLERNNAAYVVAAHLKVMLEEDYLALSKHQRQPGDMASAVSPGTPPGDQGLNAKAPQVNNLTRNEASQIIREIILPELEKEVNQGQNFAPLRQIFYSMILASWYRLALKNALLNQVYSNKAKTGGILSDDPAVKEKIYEQYLKAYKKGVFNYIKEDIDAVSKQLIPRKYFSGGVAPNLGIKLDREMSATDEELGFLGTGDLAMATVDMTMKTPDMAMAGVNTGPAKAIKILFADGPKGKQTIDNVDRILDQIRQEHPGVPIEIIRTETGVGSKGAAALQAVIEQEKPAIIFVRSDTKAFSSQDSTFIKMAKANGLKAIVRLGAGYDNINTDIAKENGISVVRTHGNAESVADLTLYLMASLANMKGFALGQSTGILSANWKDISRTKDPNEYAQLNIESTKWPKDLSDYVKQSILDTMNGHLALNEDPLKVLANVLEGQTIGLFGFGAIAQETARQLKKIKEATGANFKVIAYYTRPIATDAILQEAKRSEVTLVDTPEDLFEQTSILSVHVPDDIGLKITNENLAHKNILAVINTARDGVIETDAVHNFVARGGILLGDLDLTLKHTALMQAYPKTVMILPHIGASTQNAAAGIEANTVPVALAIVRDLLGDKTDYNLDIVNKTPIPLLNDAAMTGNGKLWGIANALVENPYVWENSGYIEKQEMEVKERLMDLLAGLSPEEIKETGSIVAEIIGNSRLNTGLKNILLSEIDKYKRNKIEAIANYFLSIYILPNVYEAAKKNRVIFILPNLTDSEVDSLVKLVEQTKNIVESRPGGSMNSDLNSFTELLKVILYYKEDKIKAIADHLKQIYGSYITEEDKRLSVMLLMAKLSPPEIEMVKEQIPNIMENNVLWHLINRFEKDKFKAFAYELAGYSSSLYDTSDDKKLWISKFLAKLTLDGIEQIKINVELIIRSSRGGFRPNFDLLAYIDNFLKNDAAMTVNGKLWGMANDLVTYAYVVDSQNDINERVTDLLANLSEEEIDELYLLVEDIIKNSHLKTSQRNILLSKIKEFHNKSGAIADFLLGYFVLPDVHQEDKKNQAIVLLASLDDKEINSLITFDEKIIDIGEKSLERKPGNKLASDVKSYADLLKLIKSFKENKSKTIADVLVRYFVSPYVTEDKKQYLAEILEAKLSPEEMKQVKSYVNSDFFEMGGNYRQDDFELLSNEIDRLQRNRLEAIAYYLVRYFVSYASNPEKILHINTLLARLSPEEIKRVRDLAKYLTETLFKPYPSTINPVDYIDKYFINEHMMKGQADQAVLTQSKVVTSPGGIDLNARNMELDVTRIGQGVEMKFDPVLIAEFRRGNFSGIVPVIIRITPIASPLPLLGINLAKAGHLVKV